MKKNSTRKVIEKMLRGHYADYKADPLYYRGRISPFYKYGVIKLWLDALEAAGYEPFTDPFDKDPYINDASDWGARAECDLSLYFHDASGTFRNEFKQLRKKAVAGGIDDMLAERRRILEGRRA